MVVEIGIEEVDPIKEVVEIKEVETAINRREDRRSQTNGIPINRNKVRDRLIEIVLLNREIQTRVTHLKMCRANRREETGRKGQGRHKTRDRNVLHKTGRHKTVTNKVGRNREISNKDRNKEVHSKEDRNRVILKIDRNVHLNKDRRKSVPHKTGLHKDYNLSLIIIEYED